MKKLFFTLIFAFTGLITFGQCYPTANFNCMSPTATYPYTYYSGGTCSAPTGQTNITVYCGYSDSPATVGSDYPGCYDEKQYGTVAPNVHVTNCNYMAPINTGLIFLVIAGGGLGVFIFKKQTKAIQGIGV